MSELQPGTVTIADLFREISGMRTDIVKALEKLAVFEARNGDADILHRDHEARLRILESFKYKIIGAMTLIGAMSGVIGAWIEATVHR